MEAGLTDSQLLKIALEAPETEAVEFLAQGQLCSVQAHEAGRSSHSRSHQPGYGDTAEVADLRPCTESEPSDEELLRLALETQPPPQPLNPGFAPDSVAPLIPHTRQLGSATAETEVADEELLELALESDAENRQSNRPGLATLPSPQRPSVTPAIASTTQDITDEELLQLAFESEAQNSQGLGRPAPPQTNASVLSCEQSPPASCAGDSLGKRKHSATSDQTSMHRPNPQVQSEPASKRLGLDPTAAAHSLAPGVGSSFRARPASPPPEDDFDDLIEEQWARPTHAPSPARAPKPSGGKSLAPTEDELMDLLFEESISHRPRQGPASSLLRPADASDLELPRWLQPSATFSAAAGPFAGSGAGPSVAAMEDIDFGAELDDCMAAGPTLARGAAAVRSGGASTSAAAKLSSAAAAPRDAAPAGPPEPPEPPGWQYTPPSRLVSAIQGTCIPITGADGERVYCRLEATNELYNKAPGSGRARRRGQLLSEPIGKLLAAAEDAQMRAIVAQSAAQWKEGADGQTELQRQHAASRQPRAARMDQEGELWVDKYAPKGYASLLSEDGMNRGVVQWLKSWDTCVFPPKQQQAANTRGGPRGAFAAEAPTNVAPKDKIILLCGAPGLGKTTLAHVAARHCGYRPYEVNASDDRTAAVLTRRIEDAVQMSSVLDSNRRPNCLIIDEIDGATGGAEGHSAIAALLKLVFGGKQAAATEAGGIVKKGKKKGGLLNRPVIAICNDLYAPALRPLREVARIVHVRVPPLDKLVARLRMICEAEGVRVDRQALLALVDKTEGDIRACVNTLQFLARRSERIRAVDVEGLDVGQKDLTKSAFAVWSEVVFAGQPSRVLRRSAPAEGRLQRQYAMLMDFGEHDLVFSGLHEAMTLLRYLDVNMSKTAGLLDWLADADRLQTSIRKRMDFHLMVYLPACALAFRHFIATTDRVTLTWPKAQSACTRKATANRELLHTWARRLPRETARVTQPMDAALDVVPSLKILTSAVRLRAVPPSMMSPADAATFHHHANLLINYGITYSMDPAAAEQAHTAGTEEEAPVRMAPLKPPLDLLHSYPGISNGVTRPLPQELCRLLAHAAAVEAIRRAEQARADKSAASKQGPQSLGAVGTQAPPTQATATAPRTAARPAALPAPQAPTPGRGAAARAQPAGVAKPTSKGNWLDALRQRGPPKKTVQPAAALQADGSMLATRKFSVLYHFNEGYTNAVKRPLLLKDLL